LCNDGGDYSLAGCRFVIHAYDVERPLLGVMRRYGGPEVPFSLRNNSFRCNLPAGSGGQGLDVLRPRMLGNEFLFSDGSAAG
jgi:hypothetical protein